MSARQPATPFSPRAGRACGAGRVRGAGRAHGAGQVRGATWLAAIGVLLAFCLASSLTVSSSALAQQDQLDDIRRQQEQLRQEIDQASRQVDAAESRVLAARRRVDETRRLLDAAQQKADAATQRYGEIHADTHLLQDQSDQMEADIAAAQSEILGLHDDIEELAVSRYIYGGQGPSLFDSQDVARQIFLDALAQFISQGNQATIDDFRIAIDDLALRQERLELLQAQLAQLEVEAQAAAESLNATYQDLAEVNDRLQADLDVLFGELAGVQAALDNLEAKLPALEREETRLEAEIAAAKARALLASQQAQGSGGSSTATFTGTLTIRSGPNWVCPVAGPFTHYKDWRAPRAYGGWHKGNDLFAPRGTPLVATESGWVVHKFNRVGGNSVHITADSGNYYYYTHLDSYENVGSGGGHWLEAGTVVGYMGNTGNAATTPVHLHFEFHQGGRGNYVDPYPYVRANCF